ncbi:RNA polymerase sigma factor SigF [Nocardia bovistercoris]|uniref:RNA polymerase sigma factor SigF n=1 Tax=Nocardia bovistercoris TaxID=2785916 RepID=A0A931IA09_9NOCA|nr:RNA polymerase sigma factor SigF [Nocardia bovistercoris]MBH0777717.1 RNA polymerase sigma factor SigF [Nocardia bovistercoris]
MTANAHSTSGSPRRRGDSYDNIEPWFDKLAGLEPDDPHRAQVREEIIGLCLPLADNIARRFAGRGVEHEDLYQVACLGLLGAVDRFDPQHGSSFLGYAVPTIMGEVRRHFRDHSWAVRVPRGVKETHLKVGGAVESLTHRLGRVPRPSEIAAELGIDRGEVTQALVAANAYRSDSLDTPAFTEDGDNHNPVLARVGAVDSAYGLLEDAITVRPLLEALPAQERQVLVWRFSEEASQSEIAARLGVSQMHVSRMLTRIFTTLREQALADPTPATDTVDHAPGTRAA